MSKLAPDRRRNPDIYPTYMSWCAMKQRCLYHRHSHFHAYGGRGIKICDTWRYSFDLFLKDMGIRPTGTTLDRIDVNGHYEPSNCRWATDSEQARNTRNKRILEIDGVAFHVSELSEKYGINVRTISVRNERGCTIEQILSTSLLHGTKNRSKTHCKRGHEFTESNTYVWNGHRTCRTCNTVKQRKWKERQRVA